MLVHLTLLQNMIKQVLVF